MKINESLCAAALAAALLICPAAAMAGDQAASPPVGQVDKDAMFNRLDADHDGKLSRQEHARPWEDKTAANRYFDQLDRDQSGFVTKDEFKPPPSTIKLLEF